MTAMTDFLVSSASTRSDGSQFMGVSLLEFSPKLFQFGKLPDAFRPETDI
jgi:hypothetical protein